MSIAWFGIPEELDTDMKIFMMENQISFSSGYLFMLRVYWTRRDGQKRRFVTSRFIPEAEYEEVDWNWNIPKIKIPTDEGLKESGRRFIRWLMSLSREDLEKALQTDEETPVPPENFCA